MARLIPRKSAVDMAAPAVRGSRIRRDPPMPEKKVTAGEIKDRDARAMAIGIATLAIALIVVLLSGTNLAGWSPSQYTWHINQGS